MYANYYYKAGADPAVLLADIVALICGALVSGLSASCDKGLTTVGGAASGWSLADAVAYNVMKSPDLSGVDKFVQLGLAGKAITMRGCETWNSATHEYGNATSAQDGGPSLLATIGQIGIIATPRMIVLFVSGGAWMACLEIYRESPAIPAGYPAFFVITQVNANGCAVRIKNYASAGSTVAYVPVKINAITGGAAAAFKGEGEADYFPLVPASVNWNGACHVGGIADCYTVSSSGRSTGDIYLTADSRQFQFFPNGSAAMGSLAIERV